MNDFVYYYYLRTRCEYECEYEYEYACLLRTLYDMGARSNIIINIAVQYRMLVLHPRVRRPQNVTEQNARRGFPSPEL